MLNQRRRWGLILLLTVAVLLAGCGGQAVTQGGSQDSPKVTAYKTLASVAKTYDQTMQAVADLYKQGLVDDKTKAQAIAYGQAFVKAYNLAIDAVEAGDNGAVAAVSTALAEFLAFVKPYLVKGGKT